MHRRQFNRLLASSSAWFAAPAINSSLSSVRTAPELKTRGVVLVPEDLSLRDWPERAKAAGLTTIALHHQNSPAIIVSLIQSTPGRDFLASCRRLGLEVEYELHAMKELLPRSLFGRDPSLFRMNPSGKRTADANLCVHSEPALEIVCKNATQLCGVLKSTTHRYFLWGDDGQPWCRCPSCREYSDSDQALLLENRLLRALRKGDPKASLAHLAYNLTLPPPVRVKPSAGVFLEFAPINRRYDLPYSEQQGSNGIAALKENLQIFPAETAQILEYWLDVSRFSNWKRPGVRLPFQEGTVRADVKTYTSLGIRHITTFAAWVDADYEARFQDLSFIKQYGAALASSQ